MVIAFDEALRAALLSTLREVQQRRGVTDIGRSHENPARCLFRLDGPQLRIVLAPELLPPRGIEEIALVEIRA